MIVGRVFSKYTALVKSLHLTQHYMGADSSDASGAVSSSTSGPTAERLEDLAYAKSQAELGGGLKRLEAIRVSGRGTARDRIRWLLDQESFIEIDTFITHRASEHNLHMLKHLGDGVVAGHGTIDGRRVYCFAQDFSVHGGSMGEMHAKKITKVVEMAERSKVPLLCIWDGGGQRAHDGIPALGGTGELLDHIVSCSGRIPIISIVLGPVVGVSALAAGLADFTILGREHGQLFLSSPLETPEFASGELIADEIGGANMHASRSGIACLIAEDEEEAMALAAEILAHFPDHFDAMPPHMPSGDPIERANEILETFVPDNPNRPYDMTKVIEEVVDDGAFLELFEAYAENIVIGLARMDGMPVGIIANQPKVLAGCLDIDASIKASRFIRTCDAFNLPLVTIEDVPGFLPGVIQEWGGIIRHGAKLLYAYAEATVPKLTLITRKAYGGAYLAMSCKHLGSDYNIAWPTAELAVMGAEGAVNVIHRREINAVEEAERENVRQNLVSDYKKKFGDPYVAARNGWLDDVIEPAETRLRLCRALRLLRNKKEWTPSKKHGNIPL
ncbi:MAG TPA: acyl-CoA carboxylase subunit beta [Candidatus Poseidoniales archaeon]|jgi:propionyl-CoA carboxylase beta chain|nr:MAG: methylmalonyl-CoA carboxyltransferase [Euryarchaeota archaeon]HIG03336.1 acyl-CoA carboxylase subunit beta [Candidatus Poseidoniales archaeon]HIK78550.1 acyl-CoA carboxylase subunit beta [Candidatus Poseidoniales archaeon]